MKVLITGGMGVIAAETSRQRSATSSKAGMVFAMNIDWFGPKWHNGETGCVIAETIVITDDGARRMLSFATDFQQLPVYRLCQPSANVASEKTHGPVARRRTEA